MSISLSLKTWLFTAKSNEELMLRYSDSGDQKLLAKLYDACADDLYHFLLTLSDPTLAKDISQLTWLKVMEKKHLYRDSGMFKGWLFTLARNLLIDEYRLKKPVNIEFDTLPAAEPASNNNEGLLQSFNQGLGLLPFSQREAFCLQQEDFSIEEIAQITHSGVETVKSRLRYAKTNLKNHLKPIVEETHVKSR